MVLVELNLGGQTLVAISARSLSVAEMFPISAAVDKMRPLLNEFAVPHPG